MFRRLAFPLAVLFGSCSVPACDHGSSGAVPDAGVEAPDASSYLLLVGKRCDPVSWRRSRHPMSTDCTDAGGRWLDFGPLGSYCDLETTDKGKPCLFPKECQGDCVYGKCSEKVSSLSEPCGSLQCVWGKLFESCALRKSHSGPGSTGTLPRGRFPNQVQRAMGATVPPGCFENGVGCAAGLDCLCCGGPGMKCLCTTSCKSDADCKDRSRPTCDRPVGGGSGLCRPSGFSCSRHLK